MPTPGLDHDGSERFDRDHLAVEFQVAFAFEDDIDFREALVVVGSRVFLNIHQMDRRELIVRRVKRAPGETAGTAHGVELVELADQIVLHAAGEGTYLLLEFLRSGNFGSRGRTRTAR